MQENPNAHCAWIEVPIGLVELARVYRCRLEVPIRNAHRARRPLAVTTGDMREIEAGAQTEADRARAGSVDFGCGYERSLWRFADWLAERGIGALVRGRAEEPPRWEA